MRGGICPEGLAWANALRRIVRPKACSAHRADLSLICPNGSPTAVATPDVLADLAIIEGRG